MITPYRGRTFQWPYAPVDVYRNLNEDRWSIRATDGPYKGLVIGHADELTVLRPVFRVSEAGRQRALRQGQRNVHAEVRGVIVEHPVLLERPLTRVRYNPARCGYFTLGTDPQARVNSAPEARFTVDGQVFI